MKLSLKRLADSLFARMALILLLGLLAAQLSSFWLQWGERASVVSQARGEHFIDRIAETVRMLEMDDSARRHSNLSAFQSRDLQVSLIDSTEVSPQPIRRYFQSALSTRIGGERDMRSSGVGEEMGRGRGSRGGRGGHGMASPRSLDIELKDGEWVRITVSPENTPPALPNELIIQLLVTLAIVGGVVMLAVRQATRPLDQLSHAVDKFGRDLDAPPLPEKGPSETLRAAQAFNRMQERIRRLVDERSRALASVSHDLRTPLTRMRLRAELIDDDELRHQMTNDLEAMAAMIDTTLDYLRGIQDSEAARPIDINALLGSLIEDEKLLGREVELTGVADTPYTGRLSALQRALQNLVDNAIKYGGNARVKVVDSQQALFISVEDDGPGVPESEMTRIIDPYYRPDQARQSSTGGAGLGLSIVNDIALLHGGELLLGNRPTGGFCATLRLPRTVK